jgi:hypothetical protein
MANGVVVGHLGTPAWAGNSIEMLLKAGLSRQHSLEDLQKKFGHKLPKLWTSYKAQFAAGGELDPFDAVIEQLHEFEEIRYPDKILEAGAQMMVTVDTMGTATVLPAPHLYRFDYTDVDRLVGKFFEVSNRPAAPVRPGGLGTPHRGSRPEDWQPEKGCRSGVGCRGALPAGHE